MKRKRAVLLLLLLSGCAGAPAQPLPASFRSASYSCLLPGERRMLVAELFFGRGIAGRAPLTEAEWGAFVAAVITPSFPQGFTVIDAEGQWRDPRTGLAVGERSKILIVAAERTADLARRLATVIDAYRAEFRQQTVGVITRDSCAMF